MIKRNLFLKNLSTPVQIIMLLLFIILSGFIVSLMGILLSFPFGGREIINNIGENNILTNINLYKFLQIIYHLGLFLIPSLLFVYFVSRSPFGYLKLDSIPNFFTLIAGMLVMFISIPFINWLLVLNQSMHLPESMGYVEKWMRDTENNAAYYTEIFLNVKSFSGLAINLIMIAVIPAIGEEILFRGVLVKLFKSWFNNIHVSIILTALIFSAVHLQFFGFLPRVVLGVILGYLFYISRNLWVAILAHFIYNAFAVTVAFFNHKYNFSTDIDKLGSNADEYPLIVLSIFLTIIVFISINQREKRFKTKGYKKKKEDEF